MYREQCLLAGCASQRVLNRPLGHSIAKYQYQFRVSPQEYPWVDPEIQLGLRRIGVPMWCEAPKGEALPEPRCWPQRFRRVENPTMRQKWMMLWRTMRVNSCSGDSSFEYVETYDADGWITVAILNVTCAILWAA